MGNLLVRLFRALPESLRVRVSDLHRSSRTVERVVTVLTAPIRNRPVEIESGPAAGLKINLAGSYLEFATGRAEQNVQDALVEHLRPGDVVYDIGANVGFFALLCARLVGPTGHVYAFEPHPGNAKALRENAARNGLAQVIEVVPIALSDTTGEAKLIVSRWSAFHRLEGANDAEATRQDRGTIKVPVATLDDYVEQHGLRPPSLVKIDVEGAEIGVLRGMRRVAADAKPKIVTECHWTNAELAETVSDFGYAVSSLDGDERVEDADPNVHTIAVPRESTAAA
jgi:FkbM family methyltransferase